MAAVTEQEQEAYRQIRKLIPEIAWYKDSTILHITDRASEKGFSGLQAYLDDLKSSETEQKYLKKHLTLQGTGFFRGDDWGVFREECFSAFSDKSSINIWCAGCSSGKEVYSVIMMLSDLLLPEKQVILASDYDNEMLSQCREGIYPLWQLEEIPRQYRHYAKRYTGSRRPDEKGVRKILPRFTFKEALKDRVQIKNINLLTDPYPEGFDLVLCRNVIKFFAPERIMEIQRRLSLSLKPGGLLFLSDDDGDGKELIADPAPMGLRQLGGRSIYQKLP